MARDRQPVLKRCRNLGLDPIVLGVNKKSNRNIRPNANRKTKSKICLWSNGKTIL